MLICPSYSDEGTRQTALLSAESRGRFCMSSGADAAPGSRVICPRGNRANARHALPAASKFCPTCAAQCDLSTCSGPKAHLKEHQTCQLVRAGSRVSGTIRAHALLRPRTGSVMK